MNGNAGLPMPDPDVPEQRTTERSGARFVADGSGGPADLVLEGGGVKGIGLAGAVLALDKAGYRFRRIAGTSAGAIAAALIAALNAAGRPLVDLNTILRTCDYPRFMAKSRLREALGQVGDVERLLLHMGMYDGDYLIEWLGGALEDIGITTFGQLGTADLDADSNWQPSQRYSLVVHTADITRGKLVRLPWDYPAYGLKPDEVRIVEAVRASMSIPFFFEPVRVDAPEAVMGGVSYAAGKVTWVDGGMLSNFPIEVFDRTDGAPSRWPTIGIKLSARATSIAAKDDVGNVVEEAIACLRTLLDNADRYYVTQDKAARTIFIDNGGIKATDFHLQVSQQDMLFGNGTTAAQTWLAARRARATTPVALPADSRDT